MSVRRYEVEFLGGPLDGHQQAITVPIEDLNVVATFPITRNLFRLLGRRPGGKPHAVTSVAVYRLERIPQGYAYRFAGASSPVTV